MSHLTLNCPTCYKQLVHVPLDGLALHYRCAEHGLLIFRPLKLVPIDNLYDVNIVGPATQLHSHDAA